MAKKNTFWRFMKGQRVRYVAAIGAMFVAMLVLAERPLVFKVAIDHIIEGKPAEGFWALFLTENLWMAAVAVVVGKAVLAAVLAAS